jgi:hypothetical protein
MPWYIVETERRTVTKYLVEATDEAGAHEIADAGEYVGYCDGPDEAIRAYGPFASRDAALDDAVSNVDGH